MNIARARHALNTFKLVLLALATAFGIWKGTTDLLVALEDAPTKVVVSASSLPDDAHWLELEGRIAVEHAEITPSPYEVHQGKDLHYAYVPVVSPGWTKGEPVWAVATFGTIKGSEVEQWRKDTSALNSVRGVLRGAEFPTDRLPGLRRHPDMFVINVGSKPDPGGAYLFLAFMLVPFALSLYVLYDLVRELRGGDKGPDPYAAQA